MLLNHVAAVLVFSGPLFWIGLWMAIDPAAFTWVPGLILRMRRHLVANAAGRASEPVFEHGAVSRRLRRTVRIAGVVLLVFGVAIR